MERDPEAKRKMVYVQAKERSGYEVLVSTDEEIERETCSAITAFVSK